MKKFGIVGEGHTDKIVIEHILRGFFAEYDLEIGPGQVLKGLLKKIDPKLEVKNIGTAQDLSPVAAASA